MKRLYKSPEFEIVKLTLSENILNISEGESGSSGGYIEQPEESMEE